MREMIERMSVYNEKQQIIAKRLDPRANEEKWTDWHWQIKHAIRDIATFKQLLGIEFSPEEEQSLAQTVQHFPLSITPYYLSLIDINDYKYDPIYRQAFPFPSELIVQDYDMEDPLTEDSDSPVPGLTHRYPDRVLFTVSNVCAMYCRHCTRKRKVGDVDFIPKKERIKQGIEYIRDNPKVRDVLLSGGDPFLLSDKQLDWILSEVTSIPHVEVVRIGTRTPVVLPYRITDALVNTLKKYQPLWINVHFNHPREITSSARNALAKLADGGFPLGNQSVLLAGVNDCPKIMKALVHKLVRNRVRPYYLYQCDLSEGLSHFRTPVAKGIEILENLIGHTSGFAVPTYVIDAPGGGGKIPLLPNYLVSWSPNKVILRNYEGVIASYKEPENYEHSFCDGNCDGCNRQVSTVGGEDEEHIGIQKLLAYGDETIALVPEKNSRMERRNGNGNSK